MEDKNEVVLKQRKTGGYRLQVRLVDGRQLQVTKKKGRKVEAYSVDILSLQDKPEIVFVVVWKWLILGISFLLFTALLFFTPNDYLDLNKYNYSNMVLASGASIGVLCLFLFWKYTPKKLIFYSRNAHIPIITLSAANPSEEKLLSFLHAVEKRIKKFRRHMDLDENKQLTGEIKMLRRLSDSGVISKKVYETAKSKLFVGFDSNFISRK